MEYMPNDIEVKLCEIMPVRALCAPLPPDFPLPLSYIVRTGGQQIERVLDAHSVSVDVYAKTWAEANYVARLCVGALRTAEADGTLRSVSVNVPYDNTDPARPDIPRVTFTCRIYERTDNR